MEAMIIYSPVVMTETETFNDIDSSTEFTKKLVFETIRSIYQKYMEL